ncbi:uncharacterized protein LOC103496672 isoform X1 [Cucumis melo]|uniref:Uncharacterized protein LOC103496672 isoform X1 n=1 Tax=Cucumis melo TaxID=3656 RepID=A0A1S3C4U8_CUCME|nr:uncharacterized protein LOC103496672 isoform X1 [Cucumis melo]
MKKRDKRLRESNIEPAVAKGLTVVHADSDQFNVEGEDAEKPKKSDKLKKDRKNKNNRQSSNDCDNLLENGRAMQLEACQPLENGAFLKGKAKKSSKKKRKDSSSLDAKGSTELHEDIDENDVYQISSGDDDSSKGMKRWITEYHKSRPGLNLLQQRIDDYITAHEAQLEQEKKEREAQAAEGGWTVVVHQKGRKKTTDAESGVTVGSVAQNSLGDKISKKKKNEVGLDFYRFQRREAQRNEVMMLQSKFEQDRKRIQQLRAARKFRPY